MSLLPQRILAFAKLGDFFRKYCEYSKNNVQLTDNEQLWFQKFDTVITLSGHKNGWFTKENILFAIQNWGNLLTQESLENWMANYQIINSRPKIVALIMAGNIPLVGFHDFLAVLLTGHSALLKMSSSDSELLPAISNYLREVSPFLAEKIVFTEGPMKDYNAVIATGSNNTSRYFEHYFGKVPNIIRKNRNSVAILSGNESTVALNALGEDIFRYYGLGCRSVSKVFVPKGYGFESFFKAIDSYRPLINHFKYANNYEYNKAVYLMSGYEILDNGFLILKKDSAHASPIATIFYEEYDDLDILQKRLLEDAEQIQCAVGKGIMASEIPFGTSQSPRLVDYADGVDTVEFLLKT